MIYVLRSFSPSEIEGGEPTEEGSGGLCVFSQAEELHYLYFRDMFCFLPRQLYLQFRNFSFQQVDHFLVVLLCAVSLSLHDLCHLQLAVQRPVLGEEPQCFLEAAKSSDECTTSPSAASHQNYPKIPSNLFTNLVQSLKLIFHWLLAVLHLFQERLRKIFSLD